MRSADDGAWSSLIGAGSHKEDGLDATPPPASAGSWVTSRTLLPLHTRPLSVSLSLSSSLSPSTSLSLSLSLMGGLAEPTGSHAMGEPIRVNGVTAEATLTRAAAGGGLRGGGWLQWREIGGQGRERCLELDREVLGVQREGRRVTVKAFVAGGGAAKRGGAGGGGKSRVRKDFALEAATEEAAEVWRAALQACIDTLGKGIQGTTETAFGESVEIISSNSLSPAIRLQWNRPCSELISSPIQHPLLRVYRPLIPRLAHQHRAAILHSSSEQSHLSLRRRPPEEAAHSREPIWWKEGGADDLPERGQAAPRCRWDLLCDARFLAISSFLLYQFFFHLPRTRHPIHAFDPSETQYQLHAQEIARKLDLTSWDGIVCVSGDGILVEVSESISSGAFYSSSSESGMLGTNFFSKKKNIYIYISVKPSLLA